MSKLAETIKREISVKKDRTADAVNVTWTFDLSTFTDEQLTEYVMRSLVIDAQRMYRADAALTTFDPIKWDEREFTSEDFKPKRRGGGTKALTKEDLLNILKDMAPDERNAMLADLNGKDEEGGEAA